MYFYLVLLLCSFVFLVFLKCLFIYFERQPVLMSWGGAENERERVPSRFCTVSEEPEVGLSLMNHEIMTWARIKNWMLNQLSHPGAPQPLLLTMMILTSTYLPERFVSSPFCFSITTLDNSTDILTSPPVIASRRPLFHTEPNPSNLFFA